MNAILDKFTVIEMAEEVFVAIPTLKDGLLDSKIVYILGKRTWGIWNEYLEM